MSIFTDQVLFFAVRAHLSLVILTTAEKAYRNGNVWNARLAVVVQVIIDALGV